ncbi:hypothetical protein PUNSTDRAFT_137898 [Punctularia strigosozonata HHB-11173 SS5]|uniref:Uncharacterized protein n=1 Tax=Punctularia strigosozonata (strain HHB-11173) TaxID=741275 RepID=R7S4S2_PUNST|nr:uncharacterized protein PUNSTDRAFT_137898 [Punctularia strigosozonata HHB-11173 SS5]EIN05218.1 hypothetical protein PUNSTDRAFT_137898 [Punctularia strigosozonata HHB-11173 SS5]
MESADDRQSSSRQRQGTRSRPATTDRQDATAPAGAFPNYRNPSPEANIDPVGGVEVNLNDSDGIADLDNDDHPISREAPAPNHGNRCSGFPGCCSHRLVNVDGKDPVKDSVPAHLQWYVVTSGKHVGVFKGWHVVMGKVEVRGSVCFRVMSAQEGVEIFNEALANGALRVWKNGRYHDISPHDIQVA